MKGVRPAVARVEGLIETLLDRAAEADAVLAKATRRGDVKEIRDAAAALTSLVERCRALALSVPGFLDESSIPAEEVREEVQKLGRGVAGVFERLVLSAPPKLANRSAEEVSDILRRELSRAALSIRECPWWPRD